MAYSRYKKALELFPGLNTRGRPTTSRVEAVPLPRPPSYVHGISDWRTTPSYRYETVTEPAAPTPAEILEELVREFETQPITRTTDPATGQTIASRSMERRELPQELRFAPQEVRDLFVRPQVPGVQYHGNIPTGPLSVNYVLPKPTGPQMTTRSVPSTDVERSIGFEASTAAPLSYANPSRFFPDAALKMPMREPGDYGIGLPAFGSTVNYPSGRFQAPPTRGTIGQTFANLPRGTAGSERFLQLGALRRLPGANTIRFRGRQPSSVRYRR